jgi:two-component system NtrC family response regulator
MSNILIVDDDEMMRSTLSLLVERKGHRASCAATLREGLDGIGTCDFDVVFLDVKMPDGNGLELLPKIEACKAAPEVIIMTGYGDPNGAELAIRNGAWDYIEKGSSIKDISLSFERALQYRQEKLAVQHARKAASLDRAGIIGNSPGIKACLEMVAQSADSDANVFISGETGTGKEVFARAVHLNSRRRPGTFVVVDCTSLPEPLVESLLFGHERGSFTGAEKAQDGLIRQANGGTLFLDEVGELPLVLQKAFLRVLQEHRFRPLGSNREVESHFRLVAATNRNLDEMVANGEFRSDLLFRLRSFIIELPPLRERREDIKELTRYHLDRFCERYGLGSKGFSPEFLQTLIDYPWPGNVREFVNTLERALAAVRFEQTLFPKHLPSHIRVQVSRSALAHEKPAAVEGLEPVCQHLPRLQVYRDTVYARAEKQYLQELLALSGENIAEACRIADLSQSRLYALLKKYRISRKD